MNQATLNTVVAAAIAKAANSPKWIRAIERAAEGLASGELVVTLLTKDALVTSANGSYRVNGSCGCEAARRGHRECKHRAAVRLVEMLETAPVPASRRPDCRYQSHLAEDLAPAPDRTDAPLSREHLG